MNIVVISASMRKNSQSFKVAKYVADNLVSNDVDVKLIDLQAIDLPMYDDTEKDLPQLNNLIPQLSAAHGFVFVSPEWDGMMSIGLLNMYHYLGSELAHKPVLPVGVSASRGGAYPIEQMRQIGAKNRHFVVIPEHVIVRNVENVLNEVESVSEEDTYIRDRLNYAGGVLRAYADAMKVLQTSALIDNTKYPNGM